MRVLVVGAGFTGTAIARTLAENDINVDVIDKRDHIGGNAYDYVNHHGIRIHKYGPHVFHTNNFRVFDWLRRFSKWTPYYHKVKAMLADGSLVPFPPNKDTLSRVPQEQIQEIFYIPYTEKMWAMPFEQVAKKTVNRTKFLSRDTDLYFPKDRLQFFPESGYTKIFENILDHSLIKLNLNTSFDHSMETDYDYCFNSMPIDEYYNHRYGSLPYRSIKFSHVDLPVVRAFECPVINFTHIGSQTRLVEWKNFPAHGGNNSWTTITYETPCDPAENNEEKYYPVNDQAGKNRELYKQYAIIPNNKTQFVGRCGNYAYIDMDQAIAHGLSVANKFLRKIK